MAAAVDNSRNGIDKRVTAHAIVNKLMELINVVPASNIVALQTLDPVEHSSNPLEFFVFFARANGIGLLAEVDIWVHGFASIFCSTSTEIPVELSEVTHASSLNYTTTPEAAALDVGAARGIWNGRVVVECSCLLSAVFFAVFGWICPGLVAFCRMIPISGERVVSLGSAVERGWSSVPFGVGGRLDLHVRVHGTFHVSFLG